MKGRDKRRRAKSRRGDAATGGRGETASPRRCGAFNALIDTTTCAAEQRYQRSVPASACAECEYKEA